MSGGIALNSGKIVLVLVTYKLNREMKTLNQILKSAVLFVIVLLLLSGSCFAAAQENQKAPDFTLEDMQGNKVWKLLLNASAEER